MKPKLFLSFLLLMFGFVGFTSAENQIINLPSDDTQIEISFDVFKCFDYPQADSDSNQAFVDDVGFVEPVGAVRTSEKSNQSNFVKIRHRERQDDSAEDDEGESLEAVIPRRTKQGFADYKAFWIFQSFGKKMRC